MVILAYMCSKFHGFRKRGEILFLTAPRAVGAMFLLQAFEARRPCHEVTGFRIARTGCSSWRPGSRGISSKAGFSGHNNH